MLRNDLVLENSSRTVTALLRRTLLRQRGWRSRPRPLPPQTLHPRLGRARRLRGCFAADERVRHGLNKSEDFHKTNE